MATPETTCFSRLPSSSFLERTTCFDGIKNCPHARTRFSRCLAVKARKVHHLPRPQRRLLAPCDPVARDVTPGWWTDNARPQTKSNKCMGTLWWTSFSGSQNCTHHFGDPKNPLSKLPLQNLGLTVLTPTPPTPPTSQKNATEFRPQHLQFRPSGLADFSGTLPFCSAAMAAGSQRSRASARSPPLVRSSDGCLCVVGGTS